MTRAPSAGTAQQTTASPAARGSNRWPTDTVTIAFVSANLALIALVVFALATFGSIRLALGYYFRGERLLVDSAQKSFGSAAPGEAVRVSFNLTNLNDEKVRILGCRAGCGCTVPCELPLALAPGESKDFTLMIHIPRQQEGGETRLDVPFTLFTSSAVQPRINLAARGELNEKLANAAPTP